MSLFVFICETEVNMKKLKLRGNYPVWSECLLSVFKLSKQWCNTYSGCRPHLFLVVGQIYTTIDRQKPAMIYTT